MREVEFVEVTGAPAAADQPASAPRRRRWWLIGALALAAVVAAAVSVGGRHPAPRAVAASTPAVSVTQGLQPVAVGLPPPGPLHALSDDDLTLIDASVCQEATVCVPVDGDPVYLTSARRAFPDAAVQERTLTSEPDGLLQAVLYGVRLTGGGALFVAAIVAHVPFDRIDVIRSWSQQLSYQSKPSCLVISATDRPVTLTAGEQAWIDGLSVR